MSSQPSSNFALTSHDYYTLDGRDELMDNSGHIRSHWQRFHKHDRGLNPSLLPRRTARLMRGLHENALTYAITDNSNQASARPMSVDPVPLLLSEEDWSVLEEGARQRAQLLNAVLTDLYGEQRLLTEGKLPAELVLGNPDFLRPLHGTRPLGGSYLHSFAMDVARGPHGNWWVLRDHSQATAASGFALENRILLNQLYPEMLRSLNVQRLAPYFQAFQEQLAAISGQEEPRILCYTSGPSDRRYLAQAYLARYLGYTMAEGPDLTMRGGNVYFKTLDGLKLVDVLFRQVDAHLCDPLELRPQSAIGVPGLVTAVREGNIAVANALGSGLVETGALAGYMPELAKAILGEELALPNLATWWCGESAAADYVHENFDHLSIGSAFDGETQTQKQLLEVPPAKRRAFLKRAGHQIIGQERMVLPTTPVQTGQTVGPAPYILRIFVTASLDGFQVMPGGLVLSGQPGRDATTADFRPVTMKDCWVQSKKEQTSLSLLPEESGLVKIRRTGKDLASRAADNLFWLGRYAERTEVTCRIMRSVISALTLDGQVLADPAAVAATTLPLMQRSGLSKTKKGEASLAFPDKLRALLSDPMRDYSIPNCVTSVGGTAGRVRDRLSATTFRTVQRLNEQQALLNEFRQKSTELNTALPALDDMVLTLNALSGQAQENMTRNTSWIFLDLGRRLERALHMVEMIRQLLATSGRMRDGRLVLLLELADSFMTYRSRYMTNPMVAPVLDLLLLDENNPRSVAFQLAQINAHLKKMTGPISEPSQPEERLIIYRLLSQLRLSDVDELSRVDNSGRRKALETILEDLETSLLSLSPLIARTYFSHAEATTTLTGQKPLGV